MSLRRLLIILVILATWEAVRRLNLVGPLLLASPSEIVGAFVIGILSDGLVMMGVSSFWQMVIKGLVIIVAVVVDQAQRRLQQRVALRQMARLG